MCLLKRPINKSTLLAIDPNLERLLNPHDLQNVPFAVELFLKLKSINFDFLNDRTVLKEATKEISCLNEILQPLLNLFCDPSISLTSQLSQIAYAGHLLFYIYRRWKGT